MAQTKFIVLYYIKHIAFIAVILSLIVFQFVTVRPVMAGDYYAASGNASDIQTAVDAAISAGGGNVYVPAGNFTLGGDVSISSGNITLIGAGANVTYLNSAASSYEITIEDGSDDVRITGFTFTHTSDASGDAIRVGAYRDYADEVEDFRIDHCDFVGFGEAEASIAIAGVNRGLIDHCNITCGEDGGNTAGYGIVVYGDNTWTDNTTAYLGTIESVFVEDCVFINCRHAIASNAGSHYVFRYNYCATNNNAQQIDAHGQTESYHGSMLAVAYNNTTIYTPGSGNKAICIRGGQTILYNNTSVNFTSYHIMYYLEDDEYLDEIVHSSYEWNNDPGNWTVYPDEDYIKEDINFHPDTEHPTYVAYTYPHPLQAGGGSGTTANITIYVTPGVIGGSCNASSYPYGTVLVNTTSNTSIAYFGVTNTSTITTNWTLQSENATWLGGATPWTHSDTATAGADQAGMKADRTDPWGGDDVAVPNATAVNIYGDCAALTDFDFGLSMVLPVTSTVNDEKANAIELTVVTP